MRLAGCSLALASLGCNWSAGKVLVKKPGREQRGSRTEKGEGKQGYDSQRSPRFSRTPGEALKCKLHLGVWPTSRQGCWSFLPPGRQSCLWDAPNEKTILYLQRRRLWCSTPSHGRMQLRSVRQKPTMLGERCVRCMKGTQEDQGWPTPSL